MEESGDKTIGRRNRQNAKQKKRIRIQQNVITSLCLACMVFSVGWSVYAAETDNTVPVDKNVSSQNSKDSSSQTDSSSSKKDSSSQADSSSSKEDSSSQADSSSSEDDSSSQADSSSSKEDSSSQADSSSSKEDSSSQADSSSSEPDTVNKSRQLVDKKDDLSDAVFIGDSRTVGMRNSSDKPKATYYCAVGLHIDTVLTSNDVSLENGQTGSVVSALKKKKFKRVYINFGTNELGWPYTDVFKEKYMQVIQKVKELQPGAVIYAESILPVTASRDAQGDSVNNTNVKVFNKIIEQAARETGIKYIDCSPAVADANGYLPEDASTDGVHLTAEYCTYWQNYIINNT